MGCNSQVSDNHGALILCNPLLQVVFTETLYFNLYTGDCRLHIYLQHGYIFRSIHCGLDIYLGVYTVGWIYIQAYTLQIGYIFRRINCRLDIYLGVYTLGWIYIGLYTVGWIYRVSSDETRQDDRLEETRDETRDERRETRMVFSISREL